MFAEQLKSNLLKVVLLLALTCLPVSGWAGLSPSVQKMKEPTVTKKEALLLQTVSEQSKKDLKTALHSLRTQMKENCSPALDFALGNLYFQLEDYTAAETAYRRALKKMPGFDRARANLARLLLQDGRQAEAKEELKNLLLSGSKSPAISTLLGYTYLLEDQPVPAESAYRQALLLDPEDENAYLGLTKSLLMQERYHEAISLLKQLVQKRPMKSELWSLQANAYLALEQPEKAISALESARRLKIATGEALATLGDLYINQGRHQLALRTYREAFDVAIPSETRLLRAIEGFLLAKDVGGAGALLKKADAVDKERPLQAKNRQKFTWLKARHAQLSGKLKLALRLYKQMVQDYPLDGAALMALGEVYHQCGERSRAVLTFQRAARIPSVKVDALVKCAQVEAEQENYAKAVELLTTAQSLRPRDYVQRYLEQLRHLLR